MGPYASAVLTDETIIARHGAPLTAEVDGETVMFDPTAGKYFALGSVGSRIWELLDEPRSVADLCALVLAEFDVGTERCRADVVPFLAELQERALVEVRS